jgi:glucose-6-phosphate-specific signal transduction histidine kinase
LVREAAPRDSAARTWLKHRSPALSLPQLGAGGADIAGSELRGLVDRVDALGGRLTLESRLGGGTHISRNLEGSADAHRPLASP